MSTFRPTVSRRRRLGVAVAVVCLAVAPITLSGCSLIQQEVQKAGGKLDLAGKKVPADFPSSQVPLVDAQIEYGASVQAPGTGEVWNLTYSSTNTGIYNSIKSQLTGAGFQGPIEENTESSGTTASFEKVPFDVLLVVSTPSNGKVSINYTVTEAEDTASPTP